jgi:hypothetical protein
LQLDYRAPCQISPPQKTTASHTVMYRHSMQQPVINHCCLYCSGESCHEGGESDDDDGEGEESDGGWGEG